MTADNDTPRTERYKANATWSLCYEMWMEAERETTALRESLAAVELMRKAAERTIARQQYENAELRYKLEVSEGCEKMMADQRDKAWAEIKELERETTALRESLAEAEKENAAYRSELVEAQRKQVKFAEDSLALEADLRSRLEAAEAHGVEIRTQFSDALLRLATAEASAAKAREDAAQVCEALAADFRASVAEGSEADGYEAQWLERAAAAIRALRGGRTAP